MTVIYNTIDLKGDTDVLVGSALEVGLRSFDCANFPKRYREDLVGKAINEKIKKGLISRNTVYIQSKFTPAVLQTTDCPYNVNASIYDQVISSVDRSLLNLKTEYLDALILHYPYPDFSDTMEAWLALEDLCRAQKIKYLGIANLSSLELFGKLYNQSTIKPSILQNPFILERSLNTYLLNLNCIAQDISYQVYGTLSQNAYLLNYVINNYQHESTPQQYYLRALLQENFSLLVSTTSKTHMKGLIDLFSFTVDDNFSYGFKAEINKQHLGEE